MHLKNFSLMHIDGLTRLSPAYDLLNTTLVLPADAEELALPLKGKRRRLNRLDWVDYWGQKRLGFSPAVVDRELSSLQAALPRMISLIGGSFLSPASQEGYLGILSRRWRVLEGGARFTHPTK
jgi:serine/threonine-protein kinase HipA